MKVPGVTATPLQALLSAGAPGGVAKELEYKSLALYELETDDPEGVIASLSARAGSPEMPMTDAIDVSGSYMMLATPAGKA